MYLLSEELIYAKKKKVKEEQLKVEEDAYHVAVYML